MDEGVAVTRESPERDFQRLLVKHLAAAFGPRVFWTHFPNGTFRGRGKQGAIRGAQLKALGVKSGCPDILIIFDGKAHWLELKAGRNSESEAQLDTIYDLKIAGSPTATVRTLAEAFHAIDKWGIPCRLSLAA